MDLDFKFFRYLDQEGTKKKSLINFNQEKYFMKIKKNLNEKRLNFRKI